MTGEELKALCEAHDFRTISIMYQSRHDTFTVYPHWDFEDDDHCASGSGPTLDAAISAAFIEAKAKRTRQEENAAEEAWQRQQEALMESGGPDDSAYRRDMINAGRGHLLR